MVCPDIEGSGGISRVVRIWRNGGIFSKEKVTHISTITDKKVNKGFYLLKALISFFFLLTRWDPLVYVHTSSYNSFRRKSLFILTALIFKRRVVLHIHPTHFHQFVLGLSGVEKILTRVLLNRIHSFVVLTEEMRANIRELMPKRPVYVLRNPVNMDEMKRPEDCKRACNKLLYLGWYLREKGVYDLVDAIEIIVSKGIAVSLDCYGTRQLDKLRSYVKRMQLQHVISVNDWIDDREKYNALFKATALVLPSYSEGIPNVILEAMATRTPIISTLVGGLKEVLKDGESAIIAQAGNPVDLSEKILKCLSDAGIRDKITSNAYREALDKYDVSIIVKDLSRIFQQLRSSP